MAIPRFPSRAFFAARRAKANARPAAPRVTGDPAEIVFGGRNVPHTTQPTDTRSLSIPPADSRGN